MKWAGTEIYHFRDHHHEERIFNNRILFSAIFVFICILVLLARFYSLQIIKYQDFVTQSDKNRIQVRPMPPNRGLIFDGAGQLLADNRPSFTLSIVKERAGNVEVLIERLANVIEITDKDKENFYKFLKQRRRPYEAVALRYRLTEEEMARLAVDAHEYQGVKIEAQLVRYYPQGDLFAHTIGYVGRINAREQASFSENDYARYSGTHSIGKIGLEKYYEDVLLGKVGYENIETNAHGRVLRVVDETPPEPGKNIELFIRSELQATAAKQLEGKRGSVVAIDVATGGVLAMVSAPSYNPNLFVTGISYADYNELNLSRDLPLFNRSIQGQYPPGSTLKPMLGLGGLHHQVVTEQTRITDPGYYQLENDERLYRDWKKGGHGNRVDLHQAIVESCDTYFYDMAFRMGIDRMHEFGTHYGLGERTGLDIPSERSGLWPSRAWKRARRNLHWFPGDSLNVSIGQGDVLATPLQLAVMTATLASRGKLIQPRLAKSIGGQPTEMAVLGQQQVSSEYWNYIIKSMEDVIHSSRGTAKIISRKIGYRMAGKTGTAQVVGIAQDEEYDRDKLEERQWDHALFIGFAPVENPEIAIAVIVENGEHGSSQASPVARAVADEYFKEVRK